MSEDCQEKRFETQPMSCTRHPQKQQKEPNLSPAREQRRFGGEKWVSPPPPTFFLGGKGGRRRRRKKRRGGGNGSGNSFISFGGGGGPSPFCGGGFLWWVVPPFIGVPTFSGGVCVCVCVPTFLMVCGCVCVFGGLLWWVGGWVGSTFLWGLGVFSLLWGGGFSPFVWDGGGGCVFHLFRGVGGWGGRQGGEVVVVMVVRTVNNEDVSDHFNACVQRI